MNFYQRQNVPGTDTPQNQAPGFVANGPQQRNAFAGAPLAQAPQAQQGQANVGQMIGGMAKLGGGILDLMGKNSAVGGQTGLSSMLPGMGGILKGAGMGASLGSFAGPYGALAGGLIGGVGSGLADLFGGGK